MNVMVATLTAAILLTATSAGADREVVAIRVWPVTSIEPSNVLVQVDVTRSPENRRLRVTADSGGFFWSSERQLDGEEGPRTSVFSCRQLPAGEYDIVAQVFGRDGRSRSVAMRSMTVLPR